MTNDTNRTRILAALSTMPDEAFGYLLLACAPSAMLHGAHAQIWPDGIGGFTQESRASIEETRAASKELIDKMREGT